jgi:UDP-GlcNAc:undecaprenyl-phosphate GlcNAc-1-phosphate transferase
MLGALGMTWAFRALAPRLGFLDRPQSEGHKTHARPVPVTGGIAMFLAWAGIIGGGLALAAYGGAASWLPERVADSLPGIRTAMPQLLWILGGAAALAVMGAMDDRRPMKAWAKFLGQAVACGLVAAFGGVRVTLFIHNPAVTWAVTTLWFMFIVNALNFLDNMDALAGGIVAVAAFFFGLIAGIREQYFVTALAAATCGTACGFLVFNRPPASIFMGDAGSQFLGFILGVLGAMTTFYKPGTPTHAPVLIPLLILAVPIFDLFAVVVIRTRLGKPVYVGDNRHISHRFAKMGLGRPLSVLSVLLLVFASGVGAVTLLWLPPFGAVLVFLQAAAILGVVSILHIFGKTEG